MRSVLQLRTSEDSNQRHGSPSLTNHESRKLHTEVRFREPQIEMAHGAGGKATRRLIDGLFVPLLFERAPEHLADAAIVDVSGLPLALTTDSFVVTPLSFPGGSIGELAVHGTLNDLAVSGARPVAMVVTFVLEAGLPGHVLEAEVRAMARASHAAGVPIVGGDTKVVEHGKADQMYVTTTGIGHPLANVTVGPKRVRPGDKVLISGPIGDHGTTILLARGELDLESDICSDTRSVVSLVETVARAAGSALHWMRDPTRGGVATALNELALDCGLGVHLSEERIPVREAVRGACELLGLDPLHIANEGQFIAVVDAENAEQVLQALRESPGGHEAEMIGEIREAPAAAVLASTRYGGTRIVDMLVGDPLPRIC